MNEQTNGKKIRIWQQNVRKSWDAQLHTIHAVGNDYDMICLQEPHFDFQEKTRATGVWRVVLPSRYVSAAQERRQVPRAAILVHESLSTNNWTQIDIDSLDVVAIQLASEQGVVNVYNIYNDCTHSDTIHTLERHFDRREVENNTRNTDSDEGDIWLGDFNRHHLMWDDPRNNRLFTGAALDEAQKLIDLLANGDMSMALPQCIPTIQNSRGNLTRPDNVFISNTIADWVIRCDVAPDDQPPKADHFPIITILDLPINRNKRVLTFNFRATDWDEFRKCLEQELNKIQPQVPIRMPPELDSALDQLEGAILQTMEAIVPKRKPSPYAKRWWTRELTQLRQEMRRQV